MKEGQFDLLVEMDRSSQQGIENIRVAIQLFMNHETQDAHLRSSAVVELNCHFASLLRLTPSPLLHSIVMHNGYKDFTIITATEKGLPCIAFVGNILLLVAEATLQKTNKSDHMKGCH